MDLSHLAQNLADLHISQILWFAVALTVARLALLRITNSSVRAIVEVVEAMLIAGVLVFLVIQPFVVKAFYIPSGSMLPTLVKDDHILVNKFVYRLGPPRREDIVVFNAPPEALRGTPEDTGGNEQVDYIKRLIALPGDTLEVHRGTVQIGTSSLGHSEVRERFGLSESAESRDEQHLKFVPNGVSVYDGQAWKNYTTQDIAEHFGAPPGIKVIVHPGYVVRNGQRLNEPYIAEDPDYDLRVTKSGDLLLDDPNEGLKINGNLPTPEEVVAVHKEPAGRIPLGRAVVMGDNRNDSNDSTRWGPLAEERLVGKAFSSFIPSAARAPSPNSRMDLLWHEREAREKGGLLIAGIDEAGRGPLAGPVVAACVILPDEFDLAGIDDSKKLSEKRREAAYVRIASEARAWAVGIVEPEEIDRINILRATHRAMRAALDGLNLAPDFLLIDGLPVPGLPCPRQKAIVGGDGASVSIAAASILAKVTRDRLMRAYDALYPAYGFARHKGYGCAAHLCALEAHGPCPLHRRSFAPVARLLAPRLTFGSTAR